MLTCRLDLRVEVEDDTSELGVVSEISHRSVATGNEDTREALQLLVGDRSEGAGVVQIVLDLHFLDELGLLWRMQVVLETGEKYGGEDDVAAHLVLLPPHPEECEGERL
jgi:hypothetical protein